MMGEGLKTIKEENDLGLTFEKLNVSYDDDDDENPTAKKYVQISSKVSGRFHIMLYQETSKQETR